MEKQIKDGIEKDKQRRKRIDGVRVDVSGFDLKPAKCLEPFIDDLKGGFEERKRAYKYACQYNPDDDDL